MHENAQKMSEKLGAKLPAIIRGYPMGKFACLEHAFSAFIEPEASPVEDQSLAKR